MKRNKKAPISDGNELHSIQQIQTNQRPKPLHIKKPQPTVKAILDKINNEFSKIDNLLPYYRSEEIYEIQELLEADIHNKKDSVIDIAALNNPSKVAEVIDIALTTRFGYTGETCGGEDERVFVFKYQAADFFNSAVPLIK